MAHTEHPLPTPTYLANASVRDLIEDFSEIRLALVYNSWLHEDWMGNGPICYRKGFPNCSERDNENYDIAHKICCILIERFSAELVRLACRGIDFNKGRRDDIIGIIKTLNDADFRTYGRKPQGEDED